MLYIIRIMSFVFTLVNICVKSLTSSFNDPANLESVCWRCHSGAIQSEEVLGYDATFGADGWPVDVKHPSILY